MAYKVTLIEGVPPNARRGIAFLESIDDGRTDGKLAFESCKQKVRYDLLSRFDHWLGGGIRDNYFHGWPNDADHKHCFVFKWKNGQGYHRLYGFLCHPRESDPSFQACILVLYARKNTEHTDVALLDFIEVLRRKPEVVAAVKLAFAVKEIYNVERKALDRAK